MSQVHPNRVIEKRAVNRVIALLEENRHVVQTIDNDFGEDLYVRFVSDGFITGDTIAIQVKGGTSYRAEGGYRVPVGKHGMSWLTANAPVVCMVYDPITNGLYWANATAQLEADRDRRSIIVPAAARLEQQTMADFVARMRRYVAERGKIKYALRLVSQPRQQLSAIAPFNGAGMCALYYRGEFAHYVPLSGTESPIYMGEVRGSGVGGIRSDLFRRLGHLGASIRSAFSTLDVNDFDCRFVVVDDNDSTQANYDYLADYFKPIWSSAGVCYGIGYHDPGPRRTGKRTPWDTLHPGRRGWDRFHEGPRTRDLIIKDIAEHLSQYPPKTSIKEIVDDILRGARAENDPLDPVIERSSQSRPGA